MFEHVAVCSVSDPCHLAMFHLSSKFLFGHGFKPQDAYLP